VTLCSFAIAFPERVIDNFHLQFRQLLHKQLTTTLTAATQVGPRIELEQLPLLLHPTLSKQFTYLKMLVFLLLKFMHWTWR